jgi:nucleoside 2-deoxyribosyltransferase
MNKHKTKVYLAGGFRTNWQNKVIEACGESFMFFNPREHELEIDSKQYTTWDLFHVKHCDILFAYMEATNPSGLGLCLEVGYAKALGKTVVLIDEKSSNDEAFAKYFKIVRESSDVLFSKLEDGIRFLLTFQK